MCACMIALLLAVLFILSSKEGFGLVVNPITICNNNCDKCSKDPNNKEACDACASCKK
jgi:hypothetical protein